MKKTLITLSIILLGALCVERLFSSTSNEATPIKVMSFNIRFNSPSDSGDTSWDKRREPCQKMVADIRPDVIGMQEPRHEMWEHILNAYPDYEKYYIPITEEIPDKKSGRIMILYLKDKYTALDSGYFWLSETPEVPSQSWNSTDRQYRAALWVHLKDKITEKDFYCVTTHFPYKKDPIDTEVRKLCSQLIVDKMQTIAGDDAVVFVTGDMNASYAQEDIRRTSLDPFYNWMKSAREEAPKTDDKVSFNGFGRNGDEFNQNKSLNIDHIFYRNAEALEFRTIVSTEYGVKYISDHYPIVCTFNIND